jgi:hypothetical protein
MRPAAPPGPEAGPGRDSDAGPNSGPDDTPAPRCTVPDGASCTVAPQCGCATDETCGWLLLSGVGPAVDGEPTCIRSTGNPDPFTGCASTADCAVGLLCVKYYNTGDHGVCNTPSTVTTGGYETCPLEVRPGRPEAGVGFSWNVQASDARPIFVCSPHCEVVTNTGCTAGMQCDGYSFAVASNTIPTCRPLGTLSLKDSCSHFDDRCGPGLHCGDPDNRCYQWCRMGRDECGAGTTGICEPFDTPSVTPDGIEYGWCSME